MKHCETTKLFYDQYKYKLVVMNSLGVIFRQKKIAQARLTLDSLQQQYDDKAEILVVSTGTRYHYIDFESFLEAKRLYSEFTKASGTYKLRIERSYMTIYSNNKSWLMLLKQQTNNPKEFWEPNNDYEELLKEPNVIIVKQPTPYQYKVTLSTSRMVDPALAKWIRANPDKAKATNRCLELIENKRWPHGQFFYVRDEKVLQLISFMIDKMGRIDKIVYVDDQDK